MSDELLNSPSTPSEVLARRIAEKLVAAGFVASEKQASVERGLATGVLTPEDWKLIVELSVGEESQRE